MAGENYLSSVKIGGNEYEIYASSAAWVPASAMEGDIPADKISAVNESAISSVSPDALPEIPVSAITDSSIAWSAIEPHTANSASDAINKLWTPSATREYVTNYVEGKISNVYKFKGTCSIGSLPSNPENGDVYDLADAGTINTGDTSHSARVEIGDNVAWVWDSTNSSGYWDKLAQAINVEGKFDTSAFEAWSSNNASVFSGTAKNAENAGTATWATQVSGTALTANGEDLITSAAAGSAASVWVSTFSSNGIGNYLTGNGSQNNKLGVETTSTFEQAQASAIPTVYAVSSFTDDKYIAKSAISADAINHQLVIDNR